MQVQKDYAQELILKAAEDAFLSQGFAKTTMRDISQRSSVGLSNIYNYFENKEAIFGALVRPLIDELNLMVDRHHDVKYMDQFVQYLRGNCEELLPRQIEDYLRIIRCYRRQLQLLFFKSQGSSYGNFISDFTDSCTAQVISYMDQFGKKYPEFGFKCSPFTYHLHTVWMFNLLSEVIKYELDPEETERVIKEYLRFEYIGWRDLINA